jgi:hypothetical protein
LGNSHQAALPQCIPLLLALNVYLEAIRDLVMPGEAATTQACGARTWRAVFALLRTPFCAGKPSVRQARTRHAKRVRHNLTGLQ